MIYKRDRKCDRLLYYDYIDGNANVFPQRVAFWIVEMISYAYGTFKVSVNCVDITLNACVNGDLTISEYGTFLIFNKNQWSKNIKFVRN